MTAMRQMFPVVLATVVGLGGVTAMAQSPSVPADRATSPSEPSNAVSSKSPTPMTTDSGRVAMSVSDATFVKKAVAGNVGEIDAAKMALEKSSNDQVKQFAQKMLDDHTRMLDQLKAAADGAGLKYEEKPSPMAQKMAARLQGLSGAAFDKAFVNGMVMDHKEDVALFGAESQNGKIEPLMKAAADSLPVIKEHLKIVQGLQKQGV